MPRFVALEPIRLDSLIRVNAESAEAITNLANRVNAVFTDEDAKNLSKISGLAADPEFQKNIKESVKNLKDLTKDFSFWKLF